MRRLRLYGVVVLFAVFLAGVMAGCGNSGGKSAPAPPQTGDVSLFPNAALITLPEDVTAPQTIILDARHSIDAYNAGHIPGAIFAPPSMFQQGGSGEEVLLPVADLEQLLGSMGISRTSKIIIYDDTTVSLGAAGRLFWILEYLGCVDVSILNGGWDQWQAQEMPIETSAPEALPAVAFAAQFSGVIPITKEYIATRLNDPGFMLVDVRTDEEYQGVALNDDPRPGHIPGAINFPYAKCFNADKTVLNFADLKVLLEANGITSSKDIVAYSTVGKRSGFFYYLTRLMGYTNVSNYAGSIKDWGSADPALYPMETGP